MRLVTGKRAALATVAVVALACGGDDATGPVLGDVRFEPAFAELDAVRDTTLRVVNSFSESVGPLIVGPSTPFSNPPGTTCVGLVVSVTPTDLGRLGPGEGTDVSVNFDFDGLPEAECPFAVYAVVISAAAASEVLGSAQIEVDHSALEP